MTKLRSLVLIICVFLIGVSYFAKNNYKSVDFIQPEVLLQPRQTKIQNAKPIKFSKDGYNYTLTPLYDYTLNGLVLHQQKYDAWYSLSRTDKTFIKDLCISWGGTIAKGDYRKKSFSVKQDSRWCWTYLGDTNLVISGNEISNNHLIASSSDIEKQIRAIGGGDQVRIIGKLVNVHAVAIGKAEKYEYPVADWVTSVSREDSGAGACEVVFVESIEVLKQANPLFHRLFRIGWYGLMLCIFWLVLEFIIRYKKMKIVD